LHLLYGGGQKIQGAEQKPKLTRTQTRGGKGSGQPVLLIRTKFWHLYLKTASLGGIGSVGKRPRAARKKSW